MSVERLRREVALDLRIRSATRAELQLLCDFFDAPMLRDHYKPVIAAARAALKKLDREAQR